MRARLVSALLLGLVLSGCVSLPDESEVRDAPNGVGTEAAAPFDYAPPGPRPGANPQEIVDGFLNSLQETPLTTTVARQFLAGSSRAQWQPSRRTLIYPNGTLRTSIRGTAVSLDLESSVQLDSRGRWLGDPTGGQPVHLLMHVVREDDQWRIADPPDALVVPRSHFDTRFARYDLHFFDPTGTVLVPEPVYLQAGVQAPSLLVSGLLAGPDPALRSVERSYFPTGTRLDISVPVTGGVAEVPLTDEILGAGSGQLDLAMAQLAWTLRQVPGVEQMRVTVDGTPVDGTTGASARSLQGWSSYDPAVPSASSDLFALRRGLVVAESSGREVALTGALRRYDARSLGLDASERDIFAVSGDGRSVLHLALPPTNGQVPRPQTVYVGTDLLRPVQDVFGWTWLVDRARDGTHLLVVHGKTVRRLQAPGASVGAVGAFALSRDGSRVAVLTDGAVTVSRVARGQKGHPSRLLSPIRMSLSPSLPARLVDVGWMSSDTLGVLGRIGAHISQVQLASVDGSSSLDAGVVGLEPLFERADDLVTWPGADAPVYLRARSGRMYEVSAAGHWTAADLPLDLVSPTFPN